MAWKTGRTREGRKKPDARYVQCNSGSGKWYCVEIFNTCALYNMQKEMLQSTIQLQSKNQVRPFFQLFN